MCNCQKHTLSDTSAPAVEEARGILTSGVLLAVAGGIGVGALLLSQTKSKRKRSSTKR